MWLLNTLKSVQIRCNVFAKPSVIYYTGVFNYILSAWAYKRKGKFVYVNKAACGGADLLTLETRNIRFRYLGKAYRVSKKRRVLALTLHYPTFKYTIWSNIKLYHKKKKRKLFKFKALTSRNLAVNFFQNMLKLRVPDTYTGRGILNNIFVYRKRKQKAATHR